MSTPTTPLKAIRAHCLWCMGGDAQYRPFRYVKECGSPTCALHPLREGTRPKGSPTPLQAIGRFCWSCMAGDATKVRRGSSTYTAARPTRLVRQCTVEDCALYPYRLGKSKA